MNSILAVAPISRGFGFVVLDSGQRAIDWGVKDIRHNRTAGSVSKASEIMDAHRPAVLVLEDWRGNHAHRSDRSTAILKSLIRVANTRNILVARISYDQVRSAFAEFNARTNQEIAEAVTYLVPDLRPLLPPPRRSWQSERYVMAIFRAGALGIACIKQRDADG